VRVIRRVSRTVFHPVPNVDSVLIGLRRTGPAPVAGLRELVAGGFAHRRKALARSLALSTGADVGAVRAGLVELGHPADARAERLSPADFAALWELL
jgi:16S rRNA (adenine1518-N6/adenine1519-N6)-dimethyltransferase